MQVNIAADKVKRRSRVSTATVAEYISAALTALLCCRSTLQPAE
jgi:hypothetical protein